MIVVRPRPTRVVVRRPGPAGPAGPPGSGGAGFAFAQVGPATPWVIAHGLGRRPSVSVTVDGVEVLADVEHLNLDTTYVYFGGPMAGSAWLI